MIKLDNSIMQEVDSQAQKDYWRDFDSGGITFTMEVNNNDLEDILQSLEAKND